MNVGIGIVSVYDWGILAFPGNFLFLPQLEATPPGSDKVIL